jgi:hypothetical protein
LDEQSRSISIDIFIASQFLATHTGIYINRTRSAVAIRISLESFYFSVILLGAADR